MSAPLVVCERSEGPQKDGVGRAKLSPIWKYRTSSIPATKVQYAIGTVQA